MLHPQFKERLPLLIKLFREKKVKRAYAFGSVVSDRFNNESDIDLLVSFSDDLDPLEKGEICWSLHDILRDIFNRDIDILIEGSLKNPYFIEEINEKKELIYAA